MKQGNVSKADAFLTNDTTRICGVRDYIEPGVTNVTVQWNGANCTRSCDFYGNDLSHIEISPKVCGLRCTQTQECTHYTWSYTNGGTCWLKNGNVSKDDAIPTNNPSMVCGIRDDRHQCVTIFTVEWNESNWTRSCDFFGNDFLRVQISSELCGLRCAQTQPCTHYAWNNGDGGTCWLKNGNVSKDDAFSTNNPTDVCGIVNDDQQDITNSIVQWNKMNWAMSCDFNGHDLFHIKMSAELCNETCLQTQECTHYTWTTLNGGTCWMKQGNVSKDNALVTDDPTMICGIITSAKGLDTKYF
ncbi:unnamed protein product [Rotaria sp. Silwood2]|nr:unnamed protein product [Rotaria sp. Silwood2]CAF4055415.1 unnamed protein product [Rotaria sp. Silwood2]